jgi:hypothetical protein
VENLQGQELHKTPQQIAGPEHEKQPVEEGLQKWVGGIFSA